MNIDMIPLWAIFICTAIIIFISIEIGYRLRSSKHIKNKNEKESAVSVTAGAVMSLLAFTLVFIFGIVFGRYDSKKELVREEANDIRTAWSRSDFLPEPNRQESKKLLLKYVDIRLEAVKAIGTDKVQALLDESGMIQQKLWNMASVNAWKDMNSDIAALYIESLNDMANIQALRVAVGLQARIPLGLWLLLYLLLFLGMLSMGYQIAVAESSKASVVKTILVLSFSLFVVLIASLDIPGKGFITVSQQPLENVKTWMMKDLKAPAIQPDTVIQPGDSLSN
jgi:hypothetical protein